jgi:hypothetical protein
MGGHRTGDAQESDATAADPWRQQYEATDEPMSRTTTILPPPSDFPVPMPEPAAESPESSSWRALVELTIDTVRPGCGDGEPVGRDR